MKSGSGGALIPALLAYQNFKSTLKLSTSSLCEAVRDGSLEAFVSERMELYTVLLFAHLTLITLPSTTLPSTSLPSTPILFQSLSLAVALKLLVTCIKPRPARSHILLGPTYPLRS